MTYDGTKGPLRYYTLSIYELGDHPELVDHINTSVVGIRGGKPVFLVRSQELLDPPCEPIELHEIKQYFFKHTEDPDE